MNNMPKFSKDTIKKLWSYIKKNNRVKIAVVVVCILLNTVATVAASLYLQTLIDKYIEPLIGVENPDMMILITPILTMIGIYAVGIITSFIYTRVMVKISQGTQRIIRDEMFAKMQKLPIRFFDTHTHGDIMSRYTNDTDTLGQMISDSLPHMFSSIVTIITVFIAMVCSNLQLTAVVIVILFVMLYVTKFVTKMSGKYFIGQQKAVGEVNRIYRRNDKWTKSYKSILSRRKSKGRI